MQKIILYILTVLFWLGFIFYIISNQDDLITGWYYFMDTQQGDIVLRTVMKYRTDWQLLSVIVLITALLTWASYHVSKTPKNPN